VAGRIKHARKVATCLTACRGWRQHSGMGPLLPCLLLKGRQCERDGGWVTELYI
jgi:hypothetical protein